MRIVVVLAWFALLSAAAAQEPASTDSGPQATPGQPPLTFVQKEMWAPAPGAFPRGLDVLEVYADRPGRHPLVVLTHGTSNVEQEREHVTPWSQLGQAMWFARCGYVAIVVVRKGYGRSGGERDGNHGGCGSRNGSFEEAGEASAEDLKAVIRFAQKLPEVDGETVVSAGVSTGGFAQAALVADPPKELKAAISFAGGRGGDGHEHNCNVDGVIAAFGMFGKGARKHGTVPMLWIYSENDHWFPPEMARRFEAAFHEGGGLDQFVMVPPYREDGHGFYYNISGWTPTVEEFLRAQGLSAPAELLPEPTAPDVDSPAGLKDRGMAAFHNFLIMGPNKAFATNGADVWGMSVGQFDQETADKKALENCEKALHGAGRCSVVARTK